ncbi:MAG: hypothetical protein ACYDCL_22860 [Myxococcales bacterium]
MSAVRSALCTAALALAAQAAAMPPLDVQVGYADQVVTARNFDLVDGQDHLSGVGLAVSVRPVARWPRLWLQLDEQYASTQADLHQTGATALQAHDLGLSALYRRRLVGDLSWFARAGARLAIANLALQDQAGNSLASQWTAEPGVGGGLGLEFAVRPAAWDATLAHDRGFGVNLEVGYAWFPDLQFDGLAPPAPNPKPTPAPIPSAPVALGPLTFSGLHIGLNVFLRY